MYSLLGVGDNVLSRDSCKLLLSEIPDFLRCEVTGSEPGPTEPLARDTSSYCDADINIWSALVLPSGSGAEETSLGVLGTLGNVCR